MASKKVRVAIIGVGNCASSLVQGVHYYRDAKETDTVPGLMHVNLGGYHVSDIEFTLGMSMLPRSGKTFQKLFLLFQIILISSLMCPRWTCLWCGV